MDDTAGPVTVEECREAIRGLWADDTPLMTAPEPIAVEVYDPKLAGWFPGFVTAWRGERVSSRYTTEPGSMYLAWLPARAARRRETGEQDGLAPVPCSP